MQSYIDVIELIQVNRIPNIECTDGKIVATLNKSIKDRIMNNLGFKFTESIALF